MLIATVGQKGGTGKSSLARLIAVELVRNGYETLVADLDHQQQTTHRWAQRRAEAGFGPPVDVRPYRTTGELSAALSAPDAPDAVVADGAPHATEATAWLARRAALTVVPTGQSLDDLEPSVSLALELVAAGVDQRRVIFAVTRSTGSMPELLSTRRSIRDAGFAVAYAHLPMSTAYAQAQDAGHTVAETRYATLNERADRLAQELFDHLQEASRGEA